MADQNEVLRLKEIAFKVRKMLLDLSESYSGILHLGGSLSMVEAIVALYHYGMNINPKDIKSPTRDRFILSKGHAAACMYITMALRGFFDFDEIVKTYGKLDSAFGTHPCKVHLPGIETSSGSLGQGFAMAVGMAISARQQKKTHRVFCMLGDGETFEGMVWEAANTAGSYKLGNLVAVIDRNKQFMTQFDGTYMNMDPYADKWRAFNWNAIEIADGNDMSSIVDAIDALPAYDSQMPTVLICNTIKGKGISFMEKNLGWHSGSLSKEQWEVATAEVEKAWELERSVV